MKIETPYGSVWIEEDKWFEYWKQTFRVVISDPGTFMKPRKSRKGYNLREQVVAQSVRRCTVAANKRVRSSPT